MVVPAPHHIQREQLEYDLGVARWRWAHNDRCSAQVHRTKRPLVASHAGFSDLFVPLRAKDDVIGLLVTGPFATARPTRADVLQRWHALTGLQGRLTDAVFAHYLQTTLSTLTLEGPLVESFERLAACFARLLTEKNAPDALADEAETMRRRLAAARFPENMWDVVAHMVDERTAVGWGTHSEGRMKAVGVEGLPQHVVVGLLRGREQADPIDDRIRRDAYQRACTGLAQKLGNVVCGRVGDHGVVFLVRHDGAGVRGKLTDLEVRAAQVARRFELRLHVGIGEADPSSWVPTLYPIALRAAEKALVTNTSVVYGAPELTDSAHELRALRIELGRCVGNRPGELSPVFERYIEAVLAHSGYRLELTRALLEAGLERIAESLLASGALDPKGLHELYASLEKAARNARTVMELVAMVRPLVSDLEGAMLDPSAARTDRSKRRALDFIHEHLSEHLSLGRVARVAGFAQDYFSRLFKKSEGVTFSRYVQGHRVEQAKQMLSNTELGIEQIQRLSGLQNRAYFYRMFKRSVGVTPSEYRDANRRG
jgi:AraC-like DNA-binding protein